MKTRISNSYVESLTQMAPGDSFFVADRDKADLFFLYRVARRAGVKISIRNVARDEIYMKNGVRVWRVN